MHGLESVADIGQGPAHNDGHRVVNVGLSFISLTSSDSTMTWSGYRCPPAGSLFSFAIVFFFHCRRPGGGWVLSEAAA